MSFNLATYDQEKTAGLAAAFAKSGYFKDAKDEAQAIVKIVAGSELGIGPMQSMTGIHIIQGKPTLSAALLGALVKRHPRYDYEVTTLTDTEVLVVFYEEGGLSAFGMAGKPKEIGRSGFTMADAQKAGVLSNPTWKKYPRNMLLSRAISNGVRWYCPDVTMGPVYAPEELGADVDEDGEVIDAPTVREVVTNGVLDAAGSVHSPDVDVHPARGGGGDPAPLSAPEGPPIDTADEAVSFRRRHPERDAPPLDTADEAVAAVVDGSSPGIHWSAKIEECATLDDCADTGAELFAWCDEGGDGNDFHKQASASLMCKRISAVAIGLIDEATAPEDVTRVTEHRAIKGLYNRDRKQHARVNAAADTGIRALEGQRA